MTYPIEKKENTADLHGKLVEIDQQADNAAIIKRHNSFLETLFPSRLQRKSAEHELALAQTEFEFRERALKIAREVQIQTIEEMYNDYLVKGKTGIRADRAKFVLSQKIMLEQNLMLATEDFNANVMEAYAHADKVPIPELKEKNMQLIYATIDSYHDLALQLQQHFQNILNEGVQA